VAGFGTAGLVVQAIIILIGKGCLYNDASASTYRDASTKKTFFYF